MIWSRQCVKSPGTCHLSRMCTQPDPWPWPAPQPAASSGEPAATFSDCSEPKVAARDSSCPGRFSEAASTSCQARGLKKTLLRSQYGGPREDCSLQSSNCKAGTAVPVVTWAGAACQLSAQRQCKTCLQTSRCNDKTKLEALLASPCETCCKAARSSQRPATMQGCKRQQFWHPKTI